jgi:5'-3' exonuclease
MGAVAFDDLEAVRPASGNNLLVVDGLNISFRWKHSGQFDFAEDFISTIESLAKSYSCGTIVVLGDYKGSDYRTGIDPEYKGNRREKYKDQTEEDKASFMEFMEGYTAALALAAVKWPMFKFKGVEADDVAAYIVKEYESKYEHIWLISTDRDWDLLLNHKVSRFSYITRKEYTIENWAEFYPVPIHKYIDFKVLQGDSGDSVPGIPGIGPVRAANLLAEYGSAFDVYAAIPLEGKAQFIQNVNASGDRILLNNQLMDLETYCEEAIGELNIEKIKRGL